MQIIAEHGVLFLKVPEVFVLIDIILVSFGFFFFFFTITLSNVFFQIVSSSTNIIVLFTRSLLIRKKEQIRKIPYSVSSIFLSL